MTYAVVVESHTHQWGEQIMAGEGVMQRALAKCTYTYLDGYPCETLTYAESVNYITEGRRVMTREAVEKYLLGRKNEDEAVRSGASGVPGDDSSSAGDPERGV